MDNKALTTVLLLNREHIERMGGKELYEPFKVEHGAFIYVTGGHGRMFINMREYDIRTQDFVTIISGSLLSLMECSDDFQAYYIIFSEKFTRDIDLWKNTIYSLMFILRNPVLQVTSDENASLVNSYCSMLHEIYTKDNITFKEEIMKNMLEAVMFAVSGFYQDARRNGRQDAVYPKLTRNHELFADFIELVTRHYETEREVMFYADKLCITPKHLGYVVKSVSGDLASEMIAKAVVMDAKSKLKSTDLTVRQISDSLNFPNPSFFGKYFKKHVGITPKEYRDGKKEPPANNRVSVLQLL